MCRKIFERSLRGVAERREAALPFPHGQEYIHRVGRTARGASGKGKALLFLMPEEGLLKGWRIVAVRSPALGPSMIRFHHHC